MKWPQKKSAVTIAEVSRKAFVRVVAVKLSLMAIFIAMGLWNNMF